MAGTAGLLDASPGHLIRADPRQPTGDCRGIPSEGWHGPEGGTGTGPRVGVVREGGGRLDREEFTSFYAASFARLVGQLSAMTGNRSEAQDAVQEAFVRAWVHRDQLDAGREAEAWVRVTAWRIAVSRWQRAREGLRLMLLALTALPSSRRCGRCPPSSAARWCCITWLS